MKKLPRNTAEFPVEGLLPDDLRRAAAVRQDVRERTQGADELLERLKRDPLVGASR